MVRGDVTVSEPKDTERASGVLDVDTNTGSIALHEVSALDYSIEFTTYLSFELVMIFISVSRQPLGLDAEENKTANLVSISPGSLLLSSRK
jgi:hypothetical protein